MRYPQRSQRKIKSRSCAVGTTPDSVSCRLVLVLDTCRTRDFYGAIRCGLPPFMRPNIGTLAERMTLDVPACETLAAEVIARGYLRWIPNADDRHEHLLSLTPTGRVMIRNLTLLHRDQMLHVGATFVQALGTILSSTERPGSEAMVDD